LAGHAYYLAIRHRVSTGICPQKVQSVLRIGACGEKFLRALMPDKMQQASASAFRSATVGKLR
jgi:hypothetical protein